MSLAVLLARQHKVTMLDLVKEKVDMVNQGHSTVDDFEIKQYMVDESLNLKATLDPEEAFFESEFVIIATPTDYDPVSNAFDTRSIESVIKIVKKVNLGATIVIKSTVPIGYTAQISIDLDVKNILFSPEFLREGKALHDNLYPSRIIVGEKSKRGLLFGQLLANASLRRDVDCLYMSSTEAEAIKLFSNSYLAMRVSFFNEIDTFAEAKQLCTKHIIDGIGLDPRIGEGYNNPSFGYGGYCLPKDTKQLMTSFRDIPCAIVPAIVEANNKRKQHICDSILAKVPDVVGIYSLAMKVGSDNCRSAAIFDIMEMLKKNDVKVLVYDDTLANINLGYEKVTELDVFIKRSDIILANRIDEKIRMAGDKLYSRDIFNTD